MQDSGSLGCRAFHLKFEFNHRKGIGTSQLLHDNLIRDLLQDLGSIYGFVLEYLLCYFRLVDISNGLE